MVIIHLTYDLSTHSLFQYKMSLERVLISNTG